MSFDLPSQPDLSLPARWCVFDEQRLLLVNGTLPGSEAASWPLTERLFLAQLGGVNLFQGELVGPMPTSGEWVSLRQALMQLPAELAPALARAAQLRQFRRTHRFCGHCATPLQQHEHDQGRHCPHCGQLYYPRLSPAMMVAIYRGQELLLARAPHFAPGIYSALAGFVEAGETLEECVHREAFEEVGVRLKNLRYVGSQSWPFPHSLMLAFTAEYAGGDIVPQEGEIEHAAWFPIDDLPLIPQSMSIAHWLIRHAVTELSR